MNSDRVIGIHRASGQGLRHLNDSRKPLGSRVDRHEHIGLPGLWDCMRFGVICADPRMRECAQDS